MHVQLHTDAMCFFSSHFYFRIHGFARKWSNGDKRSVFIASMFIAISISFAWMRAASLATKSTKIYVISLIWYAQFDAYCFLFFVSSPPSSRRFSSTRSVLRITRNELTCDSDIPKEMKMYGPLFGVCFTIPIYSYLWNRSKHPKWQHRHSFVSDSDSAEQSHVVHIFCCFVFNFFSHEIVISK